MKNKLFFLVAMIMICSCHTAKISNTHHINYVPDEQTAIKVGEAILFPIFGKEIYDETPYKAALENGVWTVWGTSKDKYGDTALMIGGHTTIKIRQSDCKILGISRLK